MVDIIDVAEPVTLQDYAAYTHLMHAAEALQRETRDAAARLEGRTVEDERFFTLTKRLHNLLHGAGDPALTAWRPRALRVGKPRPGGRVRGAPRAG